MWQLVSTLIVVFALGFLLCAMFTVGAAVDRAERPPAER